MSRYSKVCVLIFKQREVPGFLKLLNAVYLNVCMKYRNGISIILVSVIQARLELGTGSEINLWFCKSLVESHRKTVFLCFR